MFEPLLKIIWNKVKVWNGDGRKDAYTMVLTQEYLSFNELATDELAKRGHMNVRFFFACKNCRWNDLMVRTGNKIYTIESFEV